MSRRKSIVSSSKSYVVQVVLHQGKPKANRVSQILQGCWRCGVCARVVCTRAVPAAASETTCWSASTSVDVPAINIRPSVSILFGSAMYRRSKARDYGRGGKSVLRNSNTPSRKDNLQSRLVYLDPYCASGPAMSRSPTFLPGWIGRVLDPAPVVSDLSRVWTPTHG
jgi:hypothetical protein